jgi:hypothetical protein
MAWLWVAFRAARRATHNQTMTTTFDPDAHPRAGGGRFTETGHDEALDVTLDGDPGPPARRPIVRPVQGVRYTFTYMRDPGDDEPYPITETIVSGEPDPDGVWLYGENRSSSRRIADITHFELASKVAGRKVTEMARALGEARLAHRDLLRDDINADLARSFSKVERIEFELQDESDYPVDVYAQGIGHDGQLKMVAVGGGHTWHDGPHMRVPEALYEWPSEYVRDDDGLDGRSYYLDMERGLLVQEER